MPTPTSTKCVDFIDFYKDTIFTKDTCTKLGYDSHQDYINIKTYFKLKNYIYDLDNIEKIKECYNDASTNVTDEVIKYLENDQNDLNDAFTKSAYHIGMIWRLFFWVGCVIFIVFAIMFFLMLNYGTPYLFLSVIFWGVSVGIGALFCLIPYYKHKKEKDHRMSLSNINTYLVQLISPPTTTTTPPTITTTPPTTTLTPTKT